MKTIKIINRVFLPLAILALIPISSKASLILHDKTVEISLPTIQCGMCVRTIEKALNKLNGVINAEVDFENKKTVVTYDDKKTSLSKLEKAITKAGYDANNKKADTKAYEKLHDCCRVK